MKKNDESIVDVFGAVRFYGGVVRLGPTSDDLSRLASEDVAVLRCWVHVNRSGKAIGAPGVVVHNRIRSKMASSLNNEVVSDKHQFQVDSEHWDQFHDAIRESRADYVPTQIKDRLGPSGRAKTITRPPSSGSPVLAAAS